MSYYLTFFTAEAWRQKPLRMPFPYSVDTAENVVSCGEQ